jgi:hypothetical protein
MFIYSIATQGLFNLYCIQLIGGKFRKDTLLILSIEINNNRGYIMRKEIIVGIATAIGTTLLLYLAGKITQFPTVLVPSSAVVAFHAASCPDGWQEVEFTNGRFIIGVGETADLTLRHLEEKGGEEEHRLTIEEMTEHTHILSASSTDYGFLKGSDRWCGGCDTGSTYTGKTTATTINVKGTINPVGGNIPHNNMPPYVALLFCEKE